MKKKYITAVFICAAALSLGASAFAETYATVSVNGKNAELSLSSDYGRAQYTVYLLKPNDTIPNDESSVTTAFDKIESIDANGDIKGTFTRHNISFEFADNAPYGVYKAVIGGGELDGEVINVTYANPSDEQAALAEIKGASASSIGAVLDKYQDKVWSLDTDKAVYKEHKGEVEANTAAILGGSASSVQEVMTAFEKACMLAEIKNCDKAEIYTKLFMYGDYLGVDYSEDIKKQNADVIDIFSDLRKTEKVTTPLELEDVLRAAEAVAKVNSADRDTVINVLKEYNDIFKINFEGQFKSVDSYQVAKEIIAGRKYTAPSGVLNKFNEVVAELSKSKTESVVRPGGNGGGGSIANSNQSNIGSDKKFYPSIGDVNSELVSSLDTNRMFSDLENAKWAVSYVEYMAENNIMNGDGNGKFRPTDTITRAEFIKVLISALKLEDAEITNPIDFADVPSDAWYANYVKIGSSLGITNGTSPTTFSPTEQVSRQDAAVMIINAVNAAELNLYTEKKEIEFSDSENISDYAKESVSELVNAGVISGYEDGTFLPKNSLLRCETAKLIYSMLSGLKE